jgi:hypothetical protein
MPRPICSIFCIHRGCRWIPLSGRHLRRARLRKLAIWSVAALATAPAIWFGAGWFAGLSDKDPTRLFLTVILTVSGLLGLLWAIVLVVRGEKRILWANGKAACHRRPEVLKIVPVIANVCSAAAYDR